MSNNKISSFKQGVLTLTSLDLSYNYFKEIDNFPSINSISFLSLSNNQIETLLPNCFSKLQSLDFFLFTLGINIDLSYNKLKSINSSSFTNVSLIGFYLIYNQLTSNSIDPLLFKNLANLNLTGNLINKIDSNLFKYSNDLIQLDLSWNKIDTIDLDAFDNLKNLKS